MDKREKYLEIVFSKFLKYSKNKEGAFLIGTNPEGNHIISIQTEEDEIQILIRDNDVTITDLDGNSEIDLTFDELVMDRYLLEIFK